MEKMGRRESYAPKSVDDFYRSIGLEPEELEQPGKTVTEEAETAMTDEPSGAVTGEVPIPQKRISGKQRRASLDEYKEAFMHTPRIDDRKPVFISREKRDRLNRIVGLFGDNRMSVSGIVENIIGHHLQAYGEDIEAWRKL